MIKEDRVNISLRQQRDEIDRRPAWLKIVSVLVVVALLHVAVAPMVQAQMEGSQPVESTPQNDGNERTESTGSQYGLGAASVFLSIPYGLGKFLFATFGGLFGGFTYVFSGGNAKAAKSVWDTSMRGTYIITPDHLRGDKTVRFLGVPREGDQAEPEGAPAEPISIEPIPGTEPPPLK
jgi:hypothetical protein